MQDDPARGARHPDRDLDEALAQRPDLGLGAGRPARVLLQRLVQEIRVEELVRAFRERGDLMLEHGAYELRAGAEAVVPATISALIASRVDRLPASARELLADAAVLGKRCPLAHLRALVAGEGFEEDLARVEHGGFLDRQAGAPVVTLAFRHVLTQEVVSGSLLQSERQARHRRAGEMLERLYRGRSEEVCDQLAHHWGQSDQRAKAVPYLLTAADAAATVGANPEAIGHLQQALDVASVAEAGEVDGIRLKLAGLHFVVGER